MSNTYRVMSRPIDVHWAGWRSDTYTLQKAGWQIAANESSHYMGLQVAINHPGLEVKGLSNVVPIDIVTHGMHIPPLQVNLANILRILERADIHNFNAIDATPVYLADKPRDICSYNIFKPIPTEAPKEVYLEKASLAEVLDIALSKQEPKQAELRAKMLREQQLRQNSDIQANLRLVS